MTPEQLEYRRNLAQFIADRLNSQQMNYDNPAAYTFRMSLSHHLNSLRSIVAAEERRPSSNAELIYEALTMSSDNRPVEEWPPKMQILGFIRGQAKAFESRMEKGARVKWAIDAAYAAVNTKTQELSSLSRRCLS